MNVEITPVADAALPKHVYLKKGALYFQRRGWPTVRFKSAPHSDAMYEELAAILSAPLPPLPPTPPLSTDFTHPDNVGHFFAMEAAAQRRAKSAKRDHCLPKGWTERQFKKQNGRCALTGVEFVKSRARYAPLAPSIDRLDSSKGYVPDNCRLVTYMANCAKNRYSDAEFYEMCFAAIRYKSGLT